MEPFTCSYCGKDTSGVDYDYLSGYNHLSCALEAEMKEKGEYDTCIMCGVETPYKRNVHIDLRTGYIEGAGQLCKACYDRGTERRQILIPADIPADIIYNTPNDMELGAKVRLIYNQQQ